MFSILEKNLNQILQIISIDFNENITLTTIMIQMHYLLIILPRTILSTAIT